jgi:lysophospholipase L1-like esterase
MLSIGRVFAIAMGVALGATLGGGVAAGQPPPCAEFGAQVAGLRESVKQHEERSKDWANLARYRDANAKVAPPARDEARVVFMGDSITDGWSRPEMGGFFPGKPFINRGIGGQTTPQMLIRFRADVIALRPKVVVILAGTNDIAGNTGPARLSDIQDNLATMAELARAHGIRVVLASILPVSDHERDEKGTVRRQTHRRPPSQILALNRWIKKYAARSGHVYLDYFAATVDRKGWFKEELTEDGLHPDAQGYKVMAPLVLAAIETALRDQPQ